jgi:hypothetical protein
MSARRIQYTITLGALLLALAHLIWPSLTIDGITLALVVIAIIPWLAPLFKSIKLPGGLEVEYKDLEETTERLESTGLLPATLKAPTPTHAFLLVAHEDPNLALAGLRIEIEKRLIALTEKTGGMPRKRGVGGYLFYLRDNGVLTQEQHSVLADMIGLLNSAVHGAEVRKDIAAWAMDVGPKLLTELDRRIEEYN